MNHDPRWDAVTVEALKKVATYHNPSQLRRKKVAIKKSKALHKRKLQTISLNFMDTDFFHIAGLHYLTDIAIPQDRTKTLDEILIKHTISDRTLSKSRHYLSRDSKKDVKSRIEELRFLEEYLDTDNFIRIFNLRNRKSMFSVIEADYLIESWFKNSSDTVYIFLRQRKEDPKYCCIVSFFKKNEVAYGGDNLYWMEKVKESADSRQVLYINPSYKNAGHQRIRM